MGSTVTVTINIGWGGTRTPRGRRREGRLENRPSRVFHRYFRPHADSDPLDLQASGAARLVGAGVNRVQGKATARSQGKAAMNKKKP